MTTMIKEEHDWLLDHIKSEIVIAEADMEVMKYALEDIYEEKFNEALKYYKENPDLLYQSYHSCFDELNTLESTYRYNEEYEKCSVVNKVIEHLKKKYVPGFKQNL